MKSDWCLLHEALAASRREVRAIQTIKDDAKLCPRLKELRDALAGSMGTWVTSYITSQDTTTNLLKNNPTHLLSGRRART